MSLSVLLRTVNRCLRRPPVICSAVPQQQSIECVRGKAQFPSRNKKRHKYKKDVLGRVPGQAGPHPLEKIADLNSGKAEIPLLDVSYTGSIFDTQIRRRTTIRDPSLPKQKPFEHLKECLQWTDFRMLRDVNRRIIHAQLQPVRQNLTCVRKAWYLPIELRERAHKDLALKIPVKAAYSAVTNRCCITSRGKGRYIEFRMSRIFWRHLADYNYLSGVMKSTWGP